MENHEFKFICVPILHGKCALPPFTPDDRDRIGPTAHLCPYSAWGMSHLKISVRTCLNVGKM